MTELKTNEYWESLQEAAKEYNERLQYAAEHMAELMSAAGQEMMEAFNANKEASTEIFKIINEPIKEDKSRRRFEAVATFTVAVDRPVKQGQEKKADFLKRRMTWQQQLKQ